MPLQSGLVVIRKSKYVFTKIIYNGSTVKQIILLRIQFFAAIKSRFVVLCELFPENLSYDTRFNRQKITFIIANQCENDN